MRTLMLLRHAKAAAEAQVPDRERALDSHGLREARKIGVYMARHGMIPDCALISPSRRTRETWAQIAGVFAAPPVITYDERLYNAAPETIIEVIRETGKGCSVLLVLGHNPALHRVAISLTAAGDLDKREQLHEGLPTSGLVTLEFPIDDWSKLHPQSGRLSHFVTPQLLAAAD